VGATGVTNSIIKGLGNKAHVTDRLPLFARREFPVFLFSVLRRIAGVTHQSAVSRKANEVCRRGNATEILITEKQETHYALTERVS